MARATLPTQSSARHNGELIFAGPDVLRAPRAPRSMPTTPLAAKGGETR